MSRTRSLLAALALGAAVSTTLAGTVALAGPASASHASPDNGRYARAQAAVDYTIYAPGTTFGIPRTSFQRYACGGGRDDFISADYGSQASRSDRWIGLTESPGTFGCTDGPDGVAPASTFRVNGAKVIVQGSCANGRPSCPGSTPALVTRGAYTTVTLPGSADRPTPTFVEIYTQQITLDEIKQFVRKLYPAT